MAPPGKQTTAAGRRKHRFPAPAAPPWQCSRQPSFTSSP